jgi:hypothetical protein
VYATCPDGETGENPTISLFAHIFERHAIIERMFAEPDFHWRDPAWRQAAEAWIQEKTAAAGRHVTGPITGVRFLPWSAVLRAPTDQGDVYFKACGPSQRHEPALAAFLAEKRPDCMIPVLATDPALGWLLMPDGGRTLTQAIDSPAAAPDQWHRVLRLAAGVQQDLIPHAPQLMALGVLDRRPGALPNLFAAMLERPERLLAGETGALAANDVIRLRALIPRVVELSTDLAAIGPPDTFVHDDLHEDHIFAQAVSGGEWRYCFFDYGDACVTHPFMQLVSRPRFAPGRFGIEGDVVLEPLHENYLNRWAGYGSLPDLKRALNIALALGGIIRALTWINACGGYLEDLPAGLRNAYADGVTFWLRGAERRIKRLDDG